MVQRLSQVVAKQAYPEEASDPACLHDGQTDKVKMGGSRIGMRRTGERMQLHDAHLPLLRCGRPEVAQRRAPRLKARGCEGGVAQLVRVRHDRARRLNTGCDLAEWRYVRRRLPIYTVRQLRR